MTLESIYNKYLAVSRSSLNKPFKLRKDFSNFENDRVYPIVVKIKTLFDNNPEIDPDTFFAAPFKIYPDSTAHIPIDFYASRKAIGAYNHYIELLKYKEQQSLSSGVQ